MGAHELAVGAAEIGVIGGALEGVVGHGGVLSHKGVLHVQVQVEGGAAAVELLIQPKIELLKRVQAQRVELAVVELAKRRNEWSFD